MFMFYEILSGYDPAVNNEA